MRSLRCKRAAALAPVRPPMKAQRGSARSRLVGHDVHNQPVTPGRDVVLVQGRLDRSPFARTINNFLVGPNHAEEVGRGDVMNKEKLSRLAPIWIVVLMMGC